MKDKWKICHIDCTVRFPLSRQLPTCCLTTKLVDSAGEQEDTLLYKLVSKNTNRSLYKLLTSIHAIVQTGEQG